MNALDLVIEYPGAFPDDLCDEIIERFESDDRKSKGYNGNYGPEHTTSKVSIDLMISGLDEWNDIDGRLFDILTPYVQEYINILNDKFNITETRYIRDLGYQIQRTDPGGYFNWHSDDNTELITDQTYSNGTGRQTHCTRERIFTYILYLNDRYEYDDGQTEFKFLDTYKLIRPEQGKLILFPANVLFPHRGVPLESGVKYLMTGWVTRDRLSTVDNSPDDYQDRLDRYSGPDYSSYINLVDS
jgi:hypothetical protein